MQYICLHCNGCKVFKRRGLVLELENTFLFCHGEFTSAEALEWEMRWKEAAL